MTGAVLEVWKCPVDRDATILLVDEVFTNAVVHGVVGLPKGASVTVVFVEGPVGLHVEVHNPRGGNGGMLTARHASAHSDSGRGLDLVEALSEQWGSKDTPDGKLVYFDMPLSCASRDVGARQRCL
jgi:hypothetical protein